MQTIIQATLSFECVLLNLIASAIIYTILFFSYKTLKFSNAIVDKFYVMPTNSYPLQHVFC